MQFTNGNIYWREKTKIHKTYPYLTHHVSCDVLIVGGGITGAITAYFLAKEGLNVIVAEKNIVGYGSTLASSATMEYQLDMNMYKLEKMVGVNTAKKIYKLCLDAIDKIEKIDSEFDKDSEFQRQDSLYYSNKFMQKSNMSKEYNIRKEAGFNTLFLEKHNTINLNSAILTKDASAVFNPYEFTQGLLDYLNSFENVSVYENTEILDVIPKYENVICRTNNDFKIVANNVIFTSGISALKYLNIPLEIYQKFIIVTKPIDKIKNMNTNFTARDTSEPYHNIRFTNTGRIIFSGEDVKLNDRRLDEKYITSVAKNKYRRLYTTMERTFCDIDDFDIEFAFNGTCPATKDGLPIIDEIPNMPNCFCNLGFGANGILYSVIGADILKDAIKGFYTKDMYMFKINR
ncbi:MAG: FAD-dependent oxidoreductase [Clostridia bacterium]|nr:FAD-dependent oxidoreductase [Clostridia bacterium]